MCIEAQVLFEYYMHKFFSQAKFFNHLLCSFCISQEMESSTKKCIFPPKSFEVINPKQWGKIYKQCKILISYFNSKLWFAEVKILNIFIQRNLPLRHGINETNNSWAQISILYKDMELLMHYLFPILTQCEIKSSSKGNAIYLANIEIYL